MPKPARKSKRQDFSKTLKGAAFGLLACEIICASGLVACGAISQSEAIRENERREEAAMQEVNQNKINAVSRLSQINEEESLIRANIVSLEAELKSLNKRSSNYAEEYTRIQNKINALDSQYSSLELEKFRLEHAIYTPTYDKVDSDVYLPYYFIAATTAVITTSLAIGLLFICSHQKNSIRS